MALSRSEALSGDRPEVLVTRPKIARWTTRALEVPAAGATAGPVFLLLHGFGDHAGTWLPVLDELAAAGFHAVALDLPGYGEADAAADGLALPQLDEFVHAAIERWTLGGVAPILVGNSLGGALAIRAGQDPNSGVGAVVPISPAGYGHVWFIDGLERFHRLNPLMFVPVVPMKVFRQLVAGGFAWAATGGAARILPGVASAAAAQFRTRADVKRVFGNAPDLLAEIRSAGPSPVTVPCLVVWGRHDRLTPVAGADLLSAMVPAADVVVLEDCGHCSQVTRPDLVAGRLISFAATVAGSVAG